jgi:hypothetical protein
MVHTSVKEYRQPLECRATEPEQAEAAHGTLQHSTVASSAVRGVVVMVCPRGWSETKSISAME